MKPRRLFISFSGGETSAFMTLLLLVWCQHMWDEIVIIFANTGEENEETLAFVDWCDRELFAPLGHRVVYVEAVTHLGERKNSSAKVVTFATASRQGEPFEAFIAKYGIPNPKFKGCTRSLKLRPMEDYVHNILGWPRGSYQTAIGIRADEADRCAADAEARGLIYPLAHAWPTKKPNVNVFWRAMPRRLRLKGYEGNCRRCWKKSFRKLYTLMLDDPSGFDFFERMENEYGLVGPEFRKDPATMETPLPEGYHRVFFRESKSVGDLRRDVAALPPTFVRAPDDADVYIEFDPVLDVASGCGEESCEVHTDEQMDLFEDAA